eukprot:jgi/Mesvir1/28252/Mv04791-RA.1
MSVVRSVAIVGGGVAGLTVANLLTKLNLQVKVYERGVRLNTSSGAGFGLTPSCQASLASLGLKEELSHIVHPFHRWVSVDEAGATTLESSLLKQFQEKFGFFLGGARRADLLEVLRAPLEREGAVHYGCEVVGVSPQDAWGSGATSPTASPGPVTLSLSNGQHAEADLVLGCDGLRSSIARCIFSNDENDLGGTMYSGKGIFYGVMDVDKVADGRSGGGDGGGRHPLVGNPHTLVQGYDHHGDEFLHFPLGDWPDKQGRQQAMWALTYRSKAPPPDGAEWTAYPNTKVDTCNNAHAVPAVPSRATPNAISALTRVLPNYGPAHPIHHCAATTIESGRLLHFGIWYRKHRPRWHVGRVLLMGDSCRATAPLIALGANVAVDDACVFAQHMRNAGE